MFVAVKMALFGVYLALDESVRLALDMGGTITGEHGIGSYKLRWLEWEQSGAVVEIQRDRVVVDVQEFGLTERRVLELNRQRGQGGGR